MIITCLSFACFAFGVWRDVSVVGPLANVAALRVRLEAVLSALRLSQA